MSQDLRRFGTSLRRYLQTARAYSLLPRGTWSAGGCWTLARAVARHLGGELVAVEVAGRPFHIVVRCNKTIVDADGAQPDRQFLQRWVKREFQRDIPATRLVPFTRAAQRAERDKGPSAIPCDARAALALSAWMQRYHPSTRCPR